MEIRFRDAQIVSMWNCIIIRVKRSVSKKANSKSGPNFVLIETLPHALSLRRCI